MDSFMVGGRRGLCGGIVCISSSQHGNCIEKRRCGAYRASIVALQICQIQDLVYFRGKQIWAYWGLHLIFLATTSEPGQETDPPRNPHVVFCTLVVVLRHNAFISELWTCC